MSFTLFFRIESPHLSIYFKCNNIKKQRAKDKIFIPTTAEKPPFEYITVPKVGPNNAAKLSSTLFKLFISSISVFSNKIGKAL